MSKPKFISTEQIVSSESFRALNVLVEQAASELQQSLLGLQDRIGRCFAPAMAVDLPLSTSQEPEKKHVRLAADPTMVISDLKMFMDRISMSHQQVKSLKRFKLELLNDYDFTHGDDTIQRSVFGKGK